MEGIFPSVILVLKIQNMKFRMFILIAIAVLLPLCKASSQKLKVMTYNIRSVEPDFNVQPHIDLIKKQHLDIVAYQEVENRTGRMNGRDLILEIASATGMFPYFAPAYKKGSGEYGNALLSKYPIIESEYIELPIFKEHNGSDQRVALIAKLLLPNNLKLNVVCVHLDHKINRSYSYRQLKPALLPRLLDRKTPMILTGDFNAGRGSELFNKILEDFDNNDVGVFVDFIFTYPKKKWKTLNAQYLLNVDLSDHQPVVSTIEYTK